MKLVTVFPFFKVALSFFENRRFVLVLLFLAGFFIFSRDLSTHGIEYRDDEIFYYQSTQEMVQSDHVLSPTYFGENRFQKPILFYWLIFLSYKIFGINWFAARFVSVIFAALTICFTWLIGEKLFDKKSATIGSLILMTIPLFFRHAKDAVPDMTLNFFIVLAFYFALKFIERPEIRMYRYAFFVSCALGFMTKGFAALILPVVSLIVYAVAVRKPALLKAANFPLGLMIFAVLVLPWFLYMAWLHGDMYMNYILKTETYDRLIFTNENNIFLRVTSTFIHNFAFYAVNLFSYFAPWSLFAVAAIPFAVVRMVKEKKNKGPLIFLVTWFFVVFFFFSLIAARINHLILVLTTPFALILSYFFITLPAGASSLGKISSDFVKFIIASLVFLGLSGLSFLRIFLLEETALWLAVFVAIFFLLRHFLFRSREPAVVPGVMAFFILFVFFHIPLLSKARLVPFATHQAFAEMIQRDLKEDDIIAVGSNDIHEKEFQVYFTRRVEKAATNLEEATKAELRNLFLRKEAVYCLMTQKDYQYFSKSLPDRLLVLREDFMVRKRIYPDRALFFALLKLDRNAVKNYFMEKVILIKKNKNA